MNRDHADGNQKFTELVPGVEVLGGDDRIPALTRKVSEGDTVQIGNLQVRVLFTPCHTTGHVLYYVPAVGGDGDPSIFTGDTLFLGLLPSLSSLSSLVPFEDSGFLVVFF